MRVSVALFTADLRVHDNPVLQAALKNAERVVPLFVVDTGIRRTGFAVPNRAAFLADSLADLDAALRARGGQLVVRAGDVVEETCRVAAETGAAVVHIAGGVSRYAARREDRLRAELAGDRRELRVHEASLTVVPPGALTPAGKGHFAVFTPYFRRWESFPARGVLPAPDVVRLPDVGSAGLPRAESLASGSTSPGLPTGGECEARRRLRSWLAGPLSAYDERHDDLAADATSRLSPYLHFGCLSPTELLHRARTQDGPGAHAFVRQLAWRDFHHQVLAARPDAADHDYRPRHDCWRRATKDFEAWRDGRTGYPVVDAALRQLRHEGWMPGRARLLVASFLTKTLYVDWRVGARHFLDLLVDGDVANNQLNWQWVAGTGTDTRPNRLLNPLVQARRYDPRGEYVRRWLPELRHLDATAVHRVPHLDAAARAGLDYPAPIVDLAAAAARFRERRGRRVSLWARYTASTWHGQSRHHGGRAGPGQAAGAGRRPLHLARHRPADGGPAHRGTAAGRPPSPGPDPVRRETGGAGGAARLGGGKGRRGEGVARASRRTDGWPDSLAREPCQPVDHLGPFGLSGGSEGAAFRRTSFGRTWRRARAAAGLPDGLRFYDLRHTGHTLSTRSGATLKDTMVRAGQSSEKAALIYQHSDEERPRDVAAGLDDMVRAERAKQHKQRSESPAQHKEKSTGS